MQIQHYVVKHLLSEERSRSFSNVLQVIQKSFKVIDSRIDYEYVNLSFIEMLRQYVLQTYKLVYVASRSVIPAESALKAISHKKFE